MTRDDWVDTQEYPFPKKTIVLEMGKMHYVDEGSGEPIVMVHGNPTWSFLYRHLIKGLSANYRCIAIDHIGFGLSDKPRDESYLPQEHAQNLAALITKLNLKNVTLVVHDWGGPIGLSYAVHYPANVKRIVLMNSWMWPVKGDSHYEQFSHFMGGPIGQFLIKRFNFFVRVVMKRAYGDKTKWTEAIRQQYLMPFDSPHERKGCWTFAKQVLAANDWLTALWDKSDNIKSKPTLILWGKKDIAFRKKELERWKELFTDRDVILFDQVGHFVPEEQGIVLCPLVQNFLMKTA